MQHKFAQFLWLVIQKMNVRPNYIHAQDVMRIAAVLFCLLPWKEMPLLFLCVCVHSSVEDLCCHALKSTIQPYISLIKLNRCSPFLTDGMMGLIVMSRLKQFLGDVVKAGGWQTVFVLGLLKRNIKSYCNVLGLASYNSPGQSFPHSWAYRCKLQRLASVPTPPTSCFRYLPY